MNWFRKDSAGKFVWPGFGDNSRVLEWIVNRCDQEDPSAEEGMAVETPIGFVPDYKNGALNLDGVDISDEILDDLFHVDPKVWKTEVERQESYQSQFGNKLPQGIIDEREKMRQRLNDAV